MQSINRKMIILFISSLSESDKGGGAEQSLWNQIKALENKGHKCILLATSNHKGLKCTKVGETSVWLANIRNLYWPYTNQKISKAGKFIWHLLDVYNIFMQNYVYKVVHMEKPHIASIHNLPGWSGAVWKTLKNLHIPMLQVLHDHYTCCPRATMSIDGKNCNLQCYQCKLLRFPHKYLSQNVDAVVGVSNYILHRHLELGYFSQVLIKKVIYNSVDPQLVKSKTDYSEEQHRIFKIGYIGRLDSAKGIERLIDAYLQANLPSAQLWIAGDGKEDYKKYLKTKASCDPRIVFMGRVKPSEFYPKIDILVVPSIWHEPQGMVIPEAFAFGKPVIASKRGGIPEMINDGENGLLFDPDSVSELISCIHRVYYDQNLRYSLSKNSKKSSSYFLNIDSWVNAYEELYRQVLHQNHE